MANNVSEAIRRKAILVSIFLIVLLPKLTRYRSIVLHKSGICCVENGARFQINSPDALRPRNLVVYENTSLLPKDSVQKPGFFNGVRPGLIKLSLLQAEPNQFYSNLHQSASAI